MRAHGEDQPQRHGSPNDALEELELDEHRGSQRIEVGTSSTHDPGERRVSPVGYLEYADGDVKGCVCYPTDLAETTVLTERPGRAGRAPIVFLAHGNHATHCDPSDPGQEWAPGCGGTPPAGWVEILNHRGYDYFQKALAKMGIISVSVDCSATNGLAGGPSNIENRADLIIASIAHFRGLDADPTSILHERIDFRLVGLVGHSRGGEAVVLVPEVMDMPHVDIKAVIALAPTCFGASSGQPEGYSFMTILPAGDGDVWSNDGARLYDQARPGPIKCQLYVHRANHNYFNQHWHRDDAHGPRAMSRRDHETVLEVYGSAFFCHVLLRDAGAVRLLSGHAVPTGVPAGDVHLSFEWRDALTVDHHEDGNGIALNSLNLPTTQSMGLTADEYAFRQGAGSFNSSFFGNTIGMVAECQGRNGQFRSRLGASTDLSGGEVWIRAAEVYQLPSLPSGATGFELGLEDGNGLVAWVDSNVVGGLPRPYHRGPDDVVTPSIMRDATKTMLKTLRFPAYSFAAHSNGVRIGDVMAILLRCNRGDARPLAFDDLQLVYGAQCLEGPDEGE